MTPDTAGRVRSAVRALEAYRLEPRACATKLDQNEAPWDLPVGIRQTILERMALAEWNVYPDFETTRAREAVARFVGVDPSEVLVGNGSNELLLATMTAFVGPGTRVVTFSPTFPLYGKIATLLGGRVETVPHDPRSGVLDVDAMLSHVVSSSEPAVVIVASPNNPTGAVLPDDGLQRLADAGAVVLLDEAYAEFARCPRASLRPGVITFRTFSKAWGLAGLRIGHLVADSATCSEIRKCKLPYNLDRFAEEALVAVLESPGYVVANVEWVIRERGRVIEELSTIDGVTPFPSEANFVTFEVPGEPRAVYEALASEGVLVRDVSSLPGLGRALRVSIGRRGQNDRFLEIVRRFVVSSMPEALSVAGGAA